MKIKGSTIIIALMYITWVAYLFLQIWCYAKLNVFLPSEVSIATAALFISETISLARLKMVKEGCKVPSKRENKFLEQLGICGNSEIEEIIEEEQCKQQEIEVQREEEDYK